MPSLFGKSMKLKFRQLITICPYSDTTITLLFKSTTLIKYFTETKLSQISGNTIPALKKYNNIYYTNIVGTVLQETRVILLVIVSWQKYNQAILLLWQKLIMGEKVYYRKHDSVF